MAGAGSGQVWQKAERKSQGALDPPGLQAKAGWKTLEAELQYQSEYCYKKLQTELDFLHEQVHSEVSAAVAKELDILSKKLETVRSEVKQDTDTLRVTVGQLVEEAKWFRNVREEDATATQVAVRESAQKLSAEVHQLRGESVELLKQFDDSGKGRLTKELKSLEERLTEDFGTKLKVKQEETSTSFWERIEALDGSLDVAKQFQTTFGNDLQAEVKEREQLAEAARSAEAAARDSLVQLQAAVQAEASINEARFRECQAAVAQLEQRQTKALEDAEARISVRAEASDAIEAAQRTSADSLEAQLTDLSQSTQEQLENLTKEIQDIGSESREGISFCKANLARVIDWGVEVDLLQLEQDGKLDIGSPSFTASGLRDLQLQLRVEAKASRSSDHLRYSVGAFLRGGCGGQVSFRLHVGGKSQSFAAEFDQTPEWGSPKIVVLDHIGEKLNVRLEILDVTAAVGPASLWPATLSGSARYNDALQAAAKEAQAFRSMMVRRIEWRIARISERVHAAREAARSIGNEEALEPICSPPFAAGGFEGLQLHLYPLGYRPSKMSGEEQCGFFLLCPKGMYVKCRAFIGDSVRNFEHHYDEREPYGRGSFCRLLDKVLEDDSIVVGIELQEIRMEHTLQVRPGPFGSVADQLKLVSSLNVASMEPVRELRELGVGAKDVKNSKGGRQRAGYDRGSASTAAAGNEQTPKSLVPPLPQMTPMAGSKSLPILVPPSKGVNNTNNEKGPVSPSHVQPRHADVSPWR
eukprot:TRINITY_DN111028_c0_g1_i1.p1 TRINITY_DN111028_c0_g1~~TRINITY_DN111028_c0_g1_i1.p1  ORF type:complete len:761 (-),score=175.29 TRINITY_DN111028_c0_g1_i1:159-2420(-)